MPTDSASALKDRGDVIAWHQTPGVTNSEQILGRINPAVATGQRNDPQHPLVRNQRRVQPLLLRHGELEHDLPAVVELGQGGKPSAADRQLQGDTPTKIKMSAAVVLGLAPAKNPARLVRSRPSRGG